MQIGKQPTELVSLVKALNVVYRCVHVRLAHAYTQTEWVRDQNVLNHDTIFCFIYIEKSIRIVICAICEWMWFFRQNFFFFWIYWKKSSWKIDCIHQSVGLKVWKHQRNFVVGRKNTPNSSFFFNFKDQNTHSKSYTLIDCVRIYWLL